MRPGKIALIVGGVILALVALGLVGGGGALVWGYSTQRDASGYFTTGAEALATQSYAVTSEDVDLGSRPGDWIPRGVATVRIEASSSVPIFVGIGPRAAVERYLRGVAHDVLTEVRFAPFEATYRQVGGTARPDLPGERSFWVAQVSGPGTQTLRWDLESGDWTVVVMNADASSGVNASMSVGAKSPIVLPMAIGLLVLGLLVGFGAAGMIAGGAIGAGGVGVAPAPSTSTPSPRAYPVRLDGTLDPSLSRWLWLVKWFLAIPHFVVLAFLWIAAAILTIVAGLSILFTGRYPRSIFEFNVGVMRWTWRVTFYAFALGTDRYPPFTLSAVPGYPADLEIDHPDRLSNGLVLVKWWLLAIPHYLVIALFGGGFAFTTWRWGDTGGFAGAGLIGILVLVAAVSLAFTGRYLDSAFEFVMGMYRWIYRVVAYAGLMRDEYPPFRLDMGGRDPGSVVSAVPPPPAPVRGDQLLGVGGGR